MLGTTQFDQGFLWETQRAFQKYAVLLTLSKIDTIHVAFLPFKTKIVICQVGAQLISNTFTIFMYL